MSCLRELSVSELLEQTQGQCLLSKLSGGEGRGIANSRPACAVDTLSQKTNKETNKQKESLEVKLEQVEWDPTAESFDSYRKFLSKRVDSFQNVPREINPVTFMQYVL
jgi:hypothetical protein